MILGIICEMNLNDKKRWAELDMKIYICIYVCVSMSVQYGVKGYK